MIDLLQFIAASLLAFSGVPGAVSAWRHGCSTNSLFLWTWAVGATIAVFAFAVPFGNWPLGINYTVSAACGYVMIFYNKSPKDKSSVGIYCNTPPTK